MKYKSILLFALVLCLGMFSITLKANNKDKEVTRLLLEGKINLEQHHFQLAMDMFNAALEIDPNNTEALLRQGQAYFFMGNPDESIASFKKALAINPNYLPALESIAKVSRANKNYLESMKAYEQMLKLNPNNLQALANIADLYHQMKYYWQAIDIFEKIIEKYPNFIPAQIGIGRAYQELALFEKAKQAYLTVLAKEPQNNAAQVYLSKIALPTEDRVPEIITIEDQIIASPSDPNLYLKLCMLYDGIGSRTRFLGSVYRLLEVDPNNVEGIRMLAIYYEGMKKYLDSMQYYLRLIDLDPTNPSSHYRLGILYLKAKDMDKAIEEFHWAVDLEPKNPEYQLTLGSILADKEIMKVLPAIQNIASAEEEPIEPIDPRFQRIILPPGVEPLVPHDVDDFLVKFDLDEAIAGPNFKEAIKHIRKAQWIYWMQILKFWQKHPNAREGLKRADDKLKIIYDVKKKF